MATYTVKSGDSLSKIAASNGIDDWRTLYDANSDLIGSNPNLIKPGQVLTLPGSSASSGDDDSDSGLPPTGISDKQNELIEEVMGGDPEIWYDTKAEKWYLVYFVPDTDVPLLYQADKTAMDSLFPDDEWTADRHITTGEITKRGGIYAGTAEDPYGDPYAAFVEMLETEAVIRPWLKDPDMLAIEFEAVLEGRNVTDGELMTTEWWRTHSEDERAWLITYHADPMTAEALLEDAVVQTTRALSAAGVVDAPNELAQFMATQWRTGEWSQSVWDEQIRGLSDPYSGITIRPELSEAVGQSQLQTTRAYEEQIRSLVVEWLGPVHGDWPDSQIAKWAGTWRNDISGEEKLMDHLRAQRMAIWDGYENENLSYQDIAGSWRTLWSNVWGEDADETNPLFDQLMRSESYMDGMGLMRTEGLKAGNEQVMTDLEGQIAATGRKVRRTF